jgi:hypothetical protein
MIDAFPIGLWLSVPIVAALGLPVSLSIGMALGATLTVIVLRFVDEG